MPVRIMNWLCAMLAFRALECLVLTRDSAGCPAPTRPLSTLVRKASPPEQETVGPPCIFRAFRTARARWHHNLCWNTSFLTHKSARALDERRTAGLLFVSAQALIHGMAGAPGPRAAPALAVTAARQQSPGPKCSLASQSRH